MPPIEFIAQAIGIIAMGLSLWSFQQKTQKGILTVQVCSCGAFCLNFLLLGATTGAFLNAVGLVRALAYANKEKLKKEKYFFIGFVAVYVLTYVLNFTAFEKSFNLKNALVELLPVVAMVASNIGFRLKSAFAVRVTMMISSPLWLVYNLVVGSVGAVLCEVFNMVSIVTGIIRLDVKKKGAGTSLNETEGAGTSFNKTIEAGTSETETEWAGTSQMEEKGGNE